MMNIPEGTRQELAELVRKVARSHMSHPDKPCFEAVDAVFAKAAPTIEAPLKAEIEALHHERQGEVWYWQGDGEDHPESLTCPILIEAEDFRQFEAQATKELAEELRISKHLTAKLTDQCRELELQVSQARKEERERIADYLRERYGDVGRNASRRAAYAVAKDLALELTLRNAGFALKGEQH